MSGETGPRRPNRRRRIVRFKIINRLREGWSGCIIRRLFRFVTLLPLLGLLLERCFFFPYIGDSNNNILGYLDVQNVAVTTTSKTKKEETNQTVPAEFLESTITKATTRKSLEMLTQPFKVKDTASLRCPTQGTKSIPGYRYIGTKKEEPNQKQKIPRLLHQQGISRCVPSSLYDINQEWNLQFSSGGDHWSMYFHTEDAMTRLFRAVVAAHDIDSNDDQPSLTLTRHYSIPSINKEFPHLGKVLLNCVDEGSFFKRLLWRFLCLYAYGGVYADLGHGPQEEPSFRLGGENAKEPSVLRDSDDAILLWWTTAANNRKTEEGLMNPYLLAVSPGHPLMYYAVQHALFQITTDGYARGDDVSSSLPSTQNKIVSDVLERALAHFLQQEEHSNLDSYQPVQQQNDEPNVSNININDNDNDSKETIRFGRATTTTARMTYSGTGNRTVTIRGNPPNTIAPGHGENFSSSAGFLKTTREFLKAKLSRDVSSSFGGDGSSSSTSSSKEKPQYCMRKMLADASKSP